LIGILIGNALQVAFETAEFDLKGLKKGTRLSLAVDIEAASLSAPRAVARRVFWTSRPAA